MGTGLRIAEKRRDAIIALIEPESEFLLHAANSFYVGKEARTTMFTVKSLRVMLTYGSQNSPWPKRLEQRQQPLVPECSSLSSPQYDTNLRGRGKRGVRGTPTKYAQTLGRKTLAINTYYYNNMAN
ncbi:hypothetical protein OUZ56_011675 [Daphnia magna]|uniref:Uncharacterized protein n=1 Tax=Daphnia magna TaxID=35525 RepID=A0ABQ9Z104_9CRUS|nr:hypothetical protein OUZ56_011675 [Daphnia magna]